MGRLVKRIGRKKKMAGKESKRKVKGKQEESFYMNA